MNSSRAYRPALLVALLVAGFATLPLVGQITASVPVAPASSQLDTDLAAATKAHEQLKIALATTQLRLDLREGDLKELSRLLTEANAQAHSATAALASTAEREQLRQERDQARAAIAEARTAQATLQGQLQQSVIQLAAVQAQLTAVQAQYAGARAQLSSASAPVAAPTPAPVTPLAPASSPDQSSALSQLRQERDALQNQLQAATGRLTAALAQLDETNEKLSLALRAHTVQPAELDHAQQVLHDTEAALTSQLADATKTRDENGAALHSTEQELATQRATVASLTSELAGVREQLRLAQDTASAATSENQTLPDRLALIVPVPVPTAPPAPNQPAPALAPETPTAPVAQSSQPPPPIPASTAAPAPEPSPTIAAAPQVHVVVAGDTLSGLARKYYGTATRWNAILDANRGIIRNPNQLSLGAELQIP